MRISKIEKEYLKKIKLFQKYNRYYYDKSDPKVTDSEFDFLKKEIIELEKKHKFLKSKDSPSKSIGFTPSKNFKKAKHRIQMLSLSNVFNEEDLKKVIDKYIKEVPSQVNLSLPKLKKIKKITNEKFPKLNLPKLKKVVEETI